MSIKHASSKAFETSIYLRALSSILSPNTRCSTKIQFIFLRMTKSSGLNRPLKSIMSNLRSKSNLFYFKDVTMCRKGQTIWNSLQGATFPAYRISLIAARKNIQGKAETISKKLISLPPPPSWSPLYLSRTYTLVFRINVAPRLLFSRKSSHQHAPGLLIS